MQNKLLVILGPTASGKTELSVKLAKKYNGEVVSADSRQVYRGMDIGSAKITKKEMKGVPHHLLNVANPKSRFSVAQYQKLALKAIKDIQKRRKLPILVGGTGFYIQSVIDGIVIPKVKPNWELRRKLEKIALPELVKKLAELDPARAGVIDQNNPRRVLRALEIVLTTGKPIQKLEAKNQFDVLQIGLKKSPKELKENIHKRLAKRIDKIIKEVKKLRKTLSWKRLEEFGLEYRFVAQYLQNKITKEEMIERIEIESAQFAKSQMTWFKRDKRIKWVKDYKKVLPTIDKFIKK